MAKVDFCLLGPLLVRCEGVALPISSGKQRSLLAALLLSPNLVVSVDELVEALWGPVPPVSAKVTLQNYVKRLRQALAATGDSRISTASGGYLIHATADELDVSRFETLQNEAQRAAREGAWDRAAAGFRAALSLWRGEPLAGVPSEQLTLREVPRLTEMRLHAVESRADADLRLGRHAELIPELRQLSAAQPLREQFHGQLMLALYRCGRQAEALAAYRHARAILVEELGAEPGPRLRELHQQILTADPTLDHLPLAGAEPGKGSLGPAVPRQLPGTVRYFTGRSAELAMLSARAAGPAGMGGTVVISAIGGTAGVGKTALALHWAHLVADEFPDGQLYVDLRGFDPSGTPVRPEVAVRGFLDALGVPAERVPADPEAQAALYRSLLAGKRMLVLLDNARDAAQVRSLLPGTRGNLVVVTSRSQLTSLAVTAGATQISLDVLTGAEALELLASWLGPARVAGEREVAAEITELCARLPLALAIMAARAVARPGLPLGALAAELRQAKERLDVLATGDTATDVRAVFSWSYQNLGDHAARMFRLTGLHPGPSISAPVAASLVAMPLAEARAALRELAGAHLLTEHVPGRYAFHDLLRAYAAEQASTTDSDSGRQAAMHRMLDHYLHTSHAATMLISLSRIPLTLDKAQPGVSPEELVDRQQATTWFETERQVLLGVTTAAASAGFDTHAWQIPWAFAAFLQFRGHWGEYAATQRAAQAAAQRLGDLSGQAGAHYHLGLAVGMTGSYDEARDHLTQSLVLRQQLGDLVGQARSHEALGWIGERQGRHKDALEHAHLALELHRRAGHQAGQSAALNAIGWFHARLGDYEQALASCQDALALGRESGDRGIQASALDSIGFAQHHLGHHIQAVASYQQALHLYREHGHRHGTSTVLRHLGDTYYAIRDFDMARDIWRQALDILDELNHADADEVRAKLGKLGGPLPGDG